MLQRFTYAYDPGGKRTSEQIDDVVVGASYDALNRLVSQQPSGPLVLAGTTNEPATVTINGKPAASTAGNGFRALVPVPGPQFRRQRANVARVRHRLDQVPGRERTELNWSEPERR